MTQSGQHLWSRYTKGKENATHSRRQWRMELFLNMRAESICLDRRADQQLGGTRGLKGNNRPSARRRTLSSSYKALSDIGTDPVRQIELTK